MPKKLLVLAPRSAPKLKREVGHNQPEERLALICDALSSDGFDVQEMDDFSAVNFGVAELLATRVHSDYYITFLKGAWDSFQLADGNVADIDCLDAGTGGLTCESFAARWRFTPAHWERVREALPLWRQFGLFAMDLMTPILPSTWKSAMTASALAFHGASLLAPTLGVPESAGISTSSVPLAPNGMRIVYALNDSPGHHSGRETFGGYCFLNSVAIGARRFQQIVQEQRHEDEARDANNGDNEWNAPAINVPRVAIVDIDYHHGDGTQSIFAEDPSVLTVSLHAAPTLDYPYFSGFDFDEGEQVVNVPLRQGTTGSEYAEALARVLNESVIPFNPEILIVALGLDTLGGDPEASGTGGFALEPPVFVEIGKLLAKAALSIPACNGRLLVSQEGGYFLAKVPLAAVDFLNGLLAA